MHLTCISGTLWTPLWTTPNTSWTTWCPSSREWTLKCTTSCSSEYTPLFVCFVCLCWSTMVWLILFAHHYATRERTMRTLFFIHLGSLRLASSFSQQSWSGHDFRPQLAHHLVRTRAVRFPSCGPVVRFLPGMPSPYAYILCCCGTFAFIWLFVIIKAVSGFWYSAEVGQQFHCRRISCYF